MTFSQIVFLYADPWIAARGNNLQMLHTTLKPSISVLSWLERDTLWTSERRVANNLIYGSRCMKNSQIYLFDRQHTHKIPLSNRRRALQSTWSNNIRTCSLSLPLSLSLSHTHTHIFIYNGNAAKKVQRTAANSIFRNTPQTALEKICWVRSPPITPKKLVHDRANSLTHSLTSDNNNQTPSKDT